MIFIVYSEINRDSIADRIGVSEYSYHFVLTYYLPVLKRLGKVITVYNPETEVDFIFHEYKKNNENCVFLSFSPPHKTILHLECPTIPVFAWEYNTIPDESWGNNPQNDWSFVLRNLGEAITHSTFTVEAVRTKMGKNFPVTSIPAPVWDEFVQIRQKKQPASSITTLSVSGFVVDSRLIDLRPYTAQHFETIFEEQQHACPSNQLVDVTLSGVIYMALLNPLDGRKNWLDLLKGFILAFRDIEDATLVIKIVNNDEAMRDKLVHQFWTSSPFKCRVVVIQGYLSKNDYFKLTQATNYIINTSYGEGQCLPLMEYMSAGKPAIAPNHTAMKEYIDDKCAFIISYSREWTHWPHDPRLLYKTKRYFIDWESLYNAYLESYWVFKKDPQRYRVMSKHATYKLKKHCSRRVIGNKLRKVFAHSLASESGIERLLRTIRMSWLGDKINHIMNRRNLNATDKLSAAINRAVEAEKRADIAEKKSLALQNELKNRGKMPAHDQEMTDAYLSGWFQHETGELIKGFKIGPTDIVLDVGCGETPFLEFCANQQAEVICADIDEAKVHAMVDRLKKTKAKNITPLVTNANPLPLPDDCASKVIAMEVLEHVDDPAQFLQELVRVGKSGAQFLITVPDPVLEHLQKQLAPDSYFQKPNHIRIIERDEFAQLLEDAGLVIEERKSYGFYRSLWWVFFWACKQDLTPPWHPLLNSWDATWEELLSTDDGQRIKTVLDKFLPKSQAIIARKPL